MGRTGPTSTPRLAVAVEVGHAHAIFQLSQQRRCLQFGRQPSRQHLGQKTTGRRRRTYTFQTSAKLVLILIYVMHILVLDIILLSTKLLMEQLLQGYFILDVTNIMLAAIL